MGVTAVALLLLALGASASAARPASEGRLAAEALLHDSRDPMYRSPVGAVPAGTRVRLRLRTLGGDAMSVTAVIWNETTGARTLQQMTLVASTRDGGRQFDFWEATLPAEMEPGLVWYRFVVRDGPAIFFYEDDAPGEGHEPDSGRGAAFERSPDRGWLVTHHAPGFTTPAWLKNAALYQIFPDRFANGDPSNDPAPSWPTVYGLPVLHKGWSERPEGACRYYTDWCCTEDPRGRDFFGGDLEGIRQKLPYLADLGVDALYLNPVFDAPSNHKYDTRDYTRIDPAFGDDALFDRLAREASEHGIRIVLDGVFNHASSDSLYFDKLSRYPSLGAYESRESPFRDWFRFASWPDGYTRWYGVDTLPQLTEVAPVKQFFFGPGGIARAWLERGAAGWRLDAMEQKGHAFWRELRTAIKAAHPDAALLGEFWHNGAPWLTGLEMDGVMNYRFRSALIGFVNGDTVDANGRIADLPPSRLDGALRAVEEQYPAEAFAALLNLVDSHDTERILWTLTRSSDRPDQKEDAARLAHGIASLRLLTLLQLTLPGAPMIYYGDEAGITGDTDPDDRRPFPWGHEDGALRDHYRRLLGLRRELSCLRTGSWTTVLADDGAGFYGYLRQDASCAALVLVNRSDSARSTRVPAPFADGTKLTDRLSGTVYPVAGGAAALDLPARWGVLLVGPASALRLPATRPEPVWIPRAPEPPAAPRAGSLDVSLGVPSGLTVSANSHASISLAWVAPAPGSCVAGYDVLRGDTPETVTAIDRVGAAVTRYVDTDVLRGRRYVYAVRCRADGRVGQPSATVEGVPKPATVRVTLVAATPQTGDASVHVAGSFQGWVAGTTPMTRADDGRWTYTLEAHEGERLDYKYTLGSWDRIERAADLAEIPARSILVIGGPDGTQAVTDHVLRWRDADPCARAR